MIDLSIADITGPMAKVHAGAALKAARIGAGLTQFAVSSAMGIPQSRVSKIERTEKLRSDTIDAYLAVIAHTWKVVPEEPEGPPAESSADASAPESTPTS